MTQEEALEIIKKKGYTIEDGEVYQLPTQNRGKSFCLTIKLMALERVRKKLKDYAHGAR
jgi:hypothetical protein